MVSWEELEKTVVAAGENVKALKAGGDKAKIESAVAELLIAKQQVQRDCCACTAATMIHK